MTRKFTRRQWMQTSVATIATGFPLLKSTGKAHGIPFGGIDADVLLQGGLLLDGSGGEGIVGDLAIAGARIVAVGEFARGRIGRTIDCQGLVVAPGFIDLHTHCDKSLLLPQTRDNLNYLAQGCTTVVTGNCGGGENDTDKFYQQINRFGAGTNVAHLIPHGSLRSRAQVRGPLRPGSEEMSRMQRLIDEAMHAGAWGISTGLIYASGAPADTNELIELARQAGRHGGIYASHIRGEEDTLLDAVAEAIEIGRRAGMPAHISHFKANGVPQWGRIRDAAALIQSARQRGQVVTADQYPYIACATSIEGVLLPLEKIPGGYKNLFERMKADAELNRRVRCVIQEQLSRTQAAVVTRCQIPRYRGRNLAKIAAEEGKDVADVVLEIAQLGKSAVVNFSMSEEDVRWGMALPWVATGSDGAGKVASDSVLGHPRSFGTFPRKIGRYALEMKIISLTQAIRSCTGLPADILSLPERGYLRPNYFADIVVFDPKTFRDQATFEKPAVLSTGVRYLFLAGNQALENGRRSEKLFGRALCHQSKELGEESRRRTISRVGTAHALAGHRAVLEAIKRHDPEAGRQAMNQHIRTIEEDLE